MHDYPEIEVYLAGSRRILLICKYDATSGEGYRIEEYY